MLVVASPSTEGVKSEMSGREWKAIVGSYLAVKLYRIIWEMWAGAFHFNSQYVGRKFGNCRAECGLDHFIKMSIV